jgi:NTE family protein
MCGKSATGPAMNETPANVAFDTSELLRDVALFRHLDAAAFAELEGELEWFAMPGGAVLFELGDESDALYVLKSGSLGAFKPDGAGQFRLDGVVAPGETVGELGLIVDQPRSATVRALRDSELLRLSRRGFMALVEHHPDAMLQSARLAVQRLIARTVHRPLTAARTFAVLPHDAGVDVLGFARQLREALSRYGSCALIDAKTGLGNTSAWFSAIEARHRFVVYVAGAGQEPQSLGGHEAPREVSEQSDWRELCVRQADSFVLPANSDSAPSAWPEFAAAEPDRYMQRPCHLILLHRGEILLGSGRAWKAVMCDAQLHHVRRGDDVERVARLLTGRSIGLVLSGGGARGFAHIGVVRALREAGMRIDSVGGTSIGAIIGAGVASDWSDEEMLEKYRKAFVDGRPLSDYTFPFISLVSGRRVAHLLREAFGSRDIEDLALPYYCVSANLSVGKVHVHRSGPIWLWLRASSAIPGILPPVFHRSEVYVDGAVMNNLPTDIMRQQAVGEIVAVDISADDVLRADVEEYALPSTWRLFLEKMYRPRRPGILSILLRSGMVNAEAASIERRSYTNLLLAPPLSDIDLLDWHAYERAIDAGYRHACEVIGRAGAPRELP